MKTIYTFINKIRKAALLFVFSAVGLMGYAQTTQNLQASASLVTPSSIVVETGDTIAVPIVVEAQNLNDVSTPGNDLAAAGKDMLVYPNPADDKIFIESKNSISANTLVTFYNLLGRKIRIDQLAYDENRIEYDIKNLNAGIYFVKIENQDMLRVIKFVKR